MADSSNNQASSSPATSSRKRGRQQPQGEEAAEEERRKKVTAAQPPVTRLYRHALESIFAFLSLKELHAVLAVSRSWSSAEIQASESILHALPNLRTLHLHYFATRNQLPSPEQMFEGVGQCMHLTSLTISRSNITAAHMHALLLCTPSLSELSLSFMSHLESLSFLSTVASLEHSLTHFELKDCRHSNLRTKETRHIMALQQLTCLYIEDCFSEHVDSFTVDMWTQLPCTILPKLIKATIRCADPYLIMISDEDE